MNNSRRDSESFRYFIENEASSCHSVLAFGELVSNGHFSGHRTFQLLILAQNCMKYQGFAGWRSILRSVLDLGRDLRRNCDLKTFLFT
jgi:hypothetical protein